MSDEVHDDRLRRYLLGELPEEQAAEVEGRFFVDDDWTSRLLAVEAELLDECVRGELPAETRRRIEARSHASLRGRRLMGFARALRDALGPRPASRVWRFWMPLAAAAALALVLLFPPEAPRQRVAGPRATPSVPAPSRVAALLLTPQLRGGAAPARLVLSAADGLVRLEAVVDGPSGPAAPTVTVEGPAGPVAVPGPMRWSSVEGQTVVALELPAARLAAGRHRLRLGDGTEYVFEVDRVSR